MGILQILGIVTATLFIFGVGVSIGYVIGFCMGNEDALIKVKKSVNEFIQENLQEE